MHTLKDMEAQGRLLARLERVRLGLLGQDGRSIVVLLCGGSKARQRRDIADAKAFWKDYRNRQDAKKRTVR